MKVLLSGASGFIGTALSKFLSAQGWLVYRLVRRKPREEGEIFWDPEHGELAETELEGFDAIINLSGAGIADKRWSEARKKILRDSRIITTAFLFKKLSELSLPPKVIISTSATGYYGDTRERCTEEAPCGQGFLATLCRDWEAAARRYSIGAARIVILRLGVVLDPSGGALKRLLPVYRLGLGGRLGDGSQLMNWISLGDLLRVFEFVLNNSEISTTINAVNPRVITNAEFNSVLGKVLHRPVVCTVPRILLRVVLGELAEEMLLSSNCAYPEVLIRRGFEFGGIEEGVG